ncbi:MAG: 4-hydroxybenzoate octaprenyltransferase [Alphaproteobacteria bacterium]
MHDPKASSLPPRSFSSTDIPQDGWVDRLLPRSFRPYARLARLDRPIGTWLLLFPCWWGIVSVHVSQPCCESGLSFIFNDDHIYSLILALLFTVGAIVMRGAGCTYNDLVDRDIDAKVARTRTRPLVSGAVTPRQALAFLALQLAIGFGVLVVLGSENFWLGITSLGLVAIYPWMKRITWWPQFFLGLTFNWGALMGYTAMAGRLDIACFLLYAAGVAWTLGYDTIYAHQDKEDDALIGVKSTARLFAENSRAWIAVFYAVMWILLVATAWQARFSLAVLPFLIATALHLAWQVVTVDFSSPADCLRKFRSNRFVGWLVLLGFVAGHFWW